MSAQRTARAAPPILLPCHGTSSTGVNADDVAEHLAARGLAEIVEDIEQIVAAARSGREVIALDGCAASCQARLLDARGVQTLRTLNLSVADDDARGVADAETVDDLELAAGPVARTRRVPPLSIDEHGSHRHHSLDDYLLAIDTLTSPVVECGALADAPTLAAHVAQILGVSRPSAGEMLARLEDAGYVRRGPHKDVLLTTEGRAEADRVLRKQRILECFAAQTLGYEIDECRERAREIAPGFDEEALDRVWNALDRPARCPHGWPTDPQVARLEARGLVALSTVPTATCVVVERVDEASRERLRALDGAGIGPGCRLDDVAANAAAGMVGFTAGGARSSISTLLASSVLVRAA